MNVGDRTSAITSGDVEAIRAWVEDPDVCHSTLVRTAFGYLLSEVDGARALLNELSAERDALRTTIATLTAERDEAIEAMPCCRLEEMQGRSLLAHVERTRADHALTVQRLVRVTTERDEARGKVVVLEQSNREFGRALAEWQERAQDAEGDRSRALKIAYALTLDTQTAEEACASLVGMVRSARAERDAAFEWVAKLRAVAEAASALLASKWIVQMRVVDEAAPVLHHCDLDGWCFCEQPTKTVQTPEERAVRESLAALDDRKERVMADNMRMRTIGKGRYYCVCCGYDCTPTKGEPGVADEMCPSRDGDFCEPKRRLVRKGVRHA